MDSEDYYALLGVATDADDEEIRRVWRQLAQQWHPDRAGEEATAMFQQISVAYSVLSDRLARAAYDRRRGIVRKPKPEPPSEPLPRRAPGVMLGRLSRSLDALIALGYARRADDDVIELFCEDRELETGGMVRIAMRVPVTTGGDDVFSAWLAIRPGMTDGTIVMPSAQLPDVVRPVSFRIRLATS